MKGIDVSITPGKFFSNKLLALEFINDANKFKLKIIYQAKEKLNRYKIDIDGNNVIKYIRDNNVFIIDSPATDYELTVYFNSASMRFNLVID